MCLLSSRVVSARWFTATLKLLPWRLVECMNLIQCSIFTCIWHIPTTTDCFQKLFLQCVQNLSQILSFFISKVFLLSSAHFLICSRTVRSQILVLQWLHATSVWRNIAREHLVAVHYTSPSYSRSPEIMSEVCFSAFMFFSIIIWLAVCWLELLKFLVHLTRTMKQLTNRITESVQVQLRARAREFLTCQIYKTYMYISPESQEIKQFQSACHPPTTSYKVVYNV